MYCPSGIKTPKYEAKLLSGSISSRKYSIILSILRCDLNFFKCWEISCLDFSKRNVCGGEPYFMSLDKCAAQWYLYWVLDWCLSLALPPSPSSLWQKSLLQFTLMGLFQARDNCCRIGVNWNGLSCWVLDELCSETLYLDRASLIAVGWFLVFPFLVASKHSGLGIVTYMRPKFSYGLDTFFLAFFF